MRIRRIEIANFRKLADPVVIDTIEPRLTVIAGQNEEGKSTVLEALQAVFFNRGGFETGTILKNSYLSCYIAYPHEKKITHDT